MSCTTTTNASERLFLLERHNERFIASRNCWTSQERRAAKRTVIAVVICSSIMFILLANHRDTVQLLRNGERGSAIVTGKRIDSDTSSRYVTYTVASKTVEKKVHKGTYERSTIGESVPAVYDSADLSHCLVGEQIANAKNDQFVLRGWAFVSFMLIALAFAVYYEHRLLRSTGIVLMGSARKIEIIRGGEDPDEVEVIYSFRSTVGSHLEGRAKGWARRSNLSQFCPSVRPECEAVAVLYRSDGHFSLL